MKTKPNPQPFDINTLEGLTVPLTKKYDVEGLHPINSAIQEHIDPKLVLDIYIVHEIVEVWYLTPQPRKIGTIMTAGTFDEWLSWYLDDDFREGELTFYKQDPEEEDERIWIGFKEKGLIIEHKIYPHDCYICGANYTTHTSIDWGVCHNCQEKARQQVIEIRDGSDQPEDFDEDYYFECLFYFFERTEHNRKAEWLEICTDILKEIIANNT